MHAYVKISPLVLNAAYFQISVHVIDKTILTLPGLAISQLVQLLLHEQLVDLQESVVPNFRGT